MAKYARADIRHVYPGSFVFCTGWEHPHKIVPQPTLILSVRPIDSIDIKITFTVSGHIITEEFIGEELPELFEPLVTP